jgi:hypothetical protein
MVEKYFPGLIPGLLTKEIKTSDNVSFDADGVFIDSATPVIYEFNKDFNTTYKRTDIKKTWNSLRDLAIKEGMPKKEAVDYSINLWTNPEVLSRSPAIKESLGIYRYLLNRLNYIPIITVRRNELRDVTIDWFKRFLPEIPESWIFLRGPEETDANGFKINKLREKNINWHFDDSLEIIDLILKDTDTNAFFISSTGTLDILGNHERVKVIPEWEWSPELCS